MNDLIRRVAANISGHQLFARGETIVVAVSGGVDSMVLLHVLTQLAPQFGWSLIVAHYDHQLRSSSNTDARLVADFAHGCGLTTGASKGDVRRFARKNKLSIEMAARTMRHHFLIACAKETGATSIATAHHQDDQVELFFVRLLLASSLTGLAGISWPQAHFMNDKIHIARPLHNIPKAELIEFAVARKIPFHEDETNLHDDFLRNKIRNKLLPTIEREYQPAIRHIISRTQEILGEEDRFVEETLLAQATNVHSVATQRRQIENSLREKGWPATFSLIERLRAHPDTLTSLDENHFAVWSNDKKLLVFPSSSRDFKLQRIKLSLDNLSAIQFHRTQLRWRIRKTRSTDTTSRGVSGVERFDAYKIGKEIVLRHYKPGDRLHPIGMKGPVKLKTLFNNARISSLERRQRIVATTSSGEIFWVEGLRISEGFKIAPDTKNVLEWRFNPSRS